MTSIHFRTNDPSYLLPLLETEFSSAPHPDERSRRQLELLGSLLQENLQLLSDSSRQTQLRQLADTVSLQAAGSEKALLVITERFVSLYWGDRIRTDNLDEQVSYYSRLSGLPVLGLGVHGGGNLVLQAVCGRQELQAYYWFASDDLQPCSGSELAELLQLPAEIAAPLDSALGGETLEDILSPLEAALGITVEEPLSLGKPELVWPGAVLYNIV